MNESITPYAFCKFVNEALGTNLPPQMFYTYAKKGYIASEKNEAGKIVLTPEGMKKWFEERQNKSVKTTVPSYMKLVVNLSK